MFLVPYPLKQSPSQRFRFEQYFDILFKKKYSYEVQSFLDSQNWRVFFETGRPYLKLAALIKGFLRRMMILPRIPSFDFIFIHREMTPLGPPFFEWIISKLLRKKIIYDFDDAIWLTDRRSESWLLRSAKCRNKVKLICSWSYKISCGNEYLASFAKKYNDRVAYNPTTIDSKNWHNPDLHRSAYSSHDQIVIGWTGSHSTLKYLNELTSVLHQIEMEFPKVRIKIIADHKPNLELNSLQFVRWNEKTEIEDLLQLDIGIMPLPDDEWSKGKCGFKVLQYMALKIPAVASNVGVNSKIIENGSTGFLCNTPQEWKFALTRLLSDPVLRRQMGEHGRKKVVEHYSVAANSDNFVSLFE